MSYPVPPDTARLVEQFGDRCRHLGLLLDKFVPLPAIGKGEHQAAWMLPARPAAEQRGGRRDEPPDPNGWFKGTLRPDDRRDPQLWEERCKRWQAMAQAAGAQTFTATLAWRMVVGLGGQTVMETDLTLDHLTGLPIIPGSALKGLARAYAVQEVFHSSSEKPETDPPDVRRIFGSQANEQSGAKESAGTVIFFDALPVPSGGRPGLRFAVDIMNPHYPDYYRDGGKTAPSNDQTPVPVYFLTIEGAAFAFAVALRSGVDEQDAKGAEGSEQDHELALKWLKAALQRYGVGGKTSAGYGYFSNDKPAGQAPAPGAQVAQMEEPRASRLTLEQVEAWRKGKPMLGGTVIEVTSQGTIVQISDEENAPRGFIVGQRLTPSLTIPPRKVIGLYEWQGEWFVKLGS